MNIVCIVATHGRSLINFRGNLIKQLVNKGNKVICVSIEPECDMKEYINKLGAEYVQVKGTRTGISIKDSVRMIRDYKAVFVSFGVTHCFLYMSKPVAFGGIAAIIARVPHINILINGLENAYYRHSLKDAVVRAIMSSSYYLVGKRSDNVFFQNHDDLDYFKSHHLLAKKNYHIVLGSGVDMEYFSFSELPDKPHVIMIARLLWSKGIREFCSSIRQLKTEFPDLMVTLVGGLDENDEALTAQELDDFIKNNSINYVGHVNDVRPYLNESSIFVLPSYHEGIPRSVLEAMAVGRPIVTTSAPGCRETVVEGVNGYLVPVKDSEALYARIKELVCDKELRKKMGIASYKRCQELFDVRLINKEIMDCMFPKE